MPVVAAHGGGRDVGGPAHRGSVAVNRHLVPSADVARFLRPRAELVLEAPGPTRADGTRTFTLDRGPMRSWSREVAVSPAPRPDRATGGTDEGWAEVTETVRFELAVPFWAPLFRFALRRHLRRAPDEPARAPWWAPPVVLDARAATVLSLLCLVGAVAGYLGTLITQTLTYAAGQFGAGTVDQGRLLAAVRVGVLLSLVVVSAADRRGRRAVLVVAVVGSCLFTALGALAPGMVWLGVAQTLARSLSTVVALLVAIMAVEEMPAGARAFAVSVLTMTAGLGAGLCVANLVYVDRAPGAWRIAFLLPLLAIGPCWRIARRLPETHRFTRHQLLSSAEDAAGAASPASPASPAGPADPAHAADTVAAGTGGDPGPSPAEVAADTHRFAWRRFALLAASGFLWSLFLAPAAQFLNEFLRTERGFSGALIAVFVLATNTPAGLGIVVGGKLADRRGRRLVGAIGIVGGVGFTVVSYLSWGWPLWVASVLASVIGAVAVPALAVYGPELFPTGQRGAANGGLQVVSVAGSGVGLLLAGWMADRLGGLGPAMAVLAVGPAILTVLVLALYPETAGRELEDLNPVDRGASPTRAPAGDGGTLPGS